jgi:hypothetical protein
MTTIGSGPDFPEADAPGATVTARRLGSTVSRLLLWAVALYAAARMFVLFRYSVDVPYWDQWNFVDFLRETDDGASWGELWDAHNEHRVLVPNVVLLVLARLTNWNVRAEIALVHALLGLRLVIVLAVVWWAGRRAKQATWVCVPLLSAFLLTRAQAENFMWGWQVTLTLGALFTLLCCLVLVDARVPTNTIHDNAPDMRPTNGGLERHRGNWGRFVLAALLGLASQFSFASGVVLWPVGALFILMRTSASRRTRFTQASTWVAIGAIATFFYNRGLPYSPKTMPVTIKGLIEYSVKFLGTPLAPIRTVPAQLVAWRAGLAGIALFVLGMVGVWATGQWRRWAPITMWGLTAPATAGVTALGRLGFVPVEQSMSSRYVTMAVTMWAATAVLLTATVLHLVSARQTERSRSASVARSGVIGAVVVSVLALGVVTVADGWDGWAKRRQIYSLRDRAFLADESQLTPEHKSWMYPDPAMIDKQRPYLLSQRLTVFRKRPLAAPGVVTTVTGLSTPSTQPTATPETTAEPNSTRVTSTLVPTAPPNLAPQPSAAP